MIRVGRVDLPYKPLTNFELEDAAKKLKIKNFRGVFSRDEIPANLREKECGIINLDDSDGPGTHWVCFWRNYYFDSFGLAPPLELSKRGEFSYPTEQIQSRNDIICGHLCLKVLMELDRGKSLVKIISSLV